MRLPLLLVLGSLSVQAERVSMPGMIRQGRYRMAVTAAAAALERAPDDPEAMAILAAGWARSGYFGDALGAFALSTGSVWYEDFGLEIHADSLRALGRAEEAAVLHRERIGLGELPLGRELRLRMDLVDDLREAGTPWAALDEADVALALAPWSPALHAVIADCWLDLGDLDRAGAHLWRSQQLGATLRGHLVAGRLALETGHPEEAWAWSQDADRFRSNSLRVVALEAEALRRAGRAAEAFDALSRYRPAHTADPEVLAVKLRVLDDLGRRAEAEALAAELAWIYPDTRVVAETLAWHARR